MSLRFLLGILPSGQPEENNKSAYEEINIIRNEVEDCTNINFYFQTPAKFHIGMLTISLLVGIAYGGYTAYTYWMEKNTLLSYIRNLVIALAFRTFFSIVFDGAILLGSPFNVGGGNFLVSFEQICLNLVIAFWLTLNIYLHERIQRNFNNEPSLLMYQFGVPGVALFFAFLWIFTLEDQCPNLVWWIIFNPFTHWIVNSINLLYLLIQLALLANTVKAMMKITLDNDAVSLLRKTAAMMGVLVLIFWLHFGLIIGRTPCKTTESYLYFFYFVDGLECALICLILFFFNKWVLVILNKFSSLISRIEDPTSNSNEILISGSRGVMTIDSVFMTRESGRWKSAPEDGSKDVVYSNIIEPERLKKTLDLYKRLNIIPTNQVTTIEGEEFYDCQLQSSLVNENSDNSNFEKSLTSDVSQSKVLNEDKTDISLKVSEKKQKRNAFYSSKYLILDSKEREIPKYLETRPSVSSISGKDSPKDKTINQDCFHDLNSSMANGLVQKWLDDNSDITENKEKNKAFHPKQSDERKSENLETMKHQLETDENTSVKKEQVISNNTIFSAINSVVSSVFSGSNTEERKELDKELTRNFEEFCKQNVPKPFQNHQMDPEEKEITIQNISDSTEKKLIKPIVISSEHKTNFGVAEFREKNEFKTKEDETEKPQDAQNKEFKNKEQVLEPQENKPIGTTNEIVSSEYPGSKFKTKPDEPSALTEIEKQKKKYKTPEDQSLKPTHAESYLEEPTNDNKPKIDTEKSDGNITKIEAQTLNGFGEKLPLLETVVHGVGLPEKNSEMVEEGRPSGESPDEFNYKHELPDLGISESAEIFKSDLSLSHTANELQIKPTPTIKDAKESEPEPEKFLDQCINYSDLLEFRSQQDKSTTDQPAGLSKKFFEFSEVLSSTIGSLLSTTSSFFTIRKHFSDSEKPNEFEISEFENKEIREPKNFEFDQNEKTQEEILKNHQKTALTMPINESGIMESSSESEFSIERKRDSSSSAGSFSVDHYYSQIMKLNSNFYNQSNYVYEKQKKKNF